LLRPIALALPCAAFAAWVPTSWIVEHWPALSRMGKLAAGVVYAGILFGSVVGAEVVLRSVRSYRNARPGLPRVHPLWLGAAGVLGITSYLADRWVLVGLYEDFHYGLSVAFFACLASFGTLCLESVRVRRPDLRVRAAQLGRPLVMSVGLALACASLLTVERLSPDVFGPNRSPLFPKLVRSARGYTDFDRDGLSSLFGGSDCAPFNPGIRPGVFDMPGNRIDEDCTGSDARWPKPKRGEKYAIPKLAAYNVLLITIDALRADHVGAYGYTRNPTTPNIDRLAKRSSRFTEAFSPAPKTRLTMPSLLTGLYPSNVPLNYGARPRKGKRRRAPLGREAQLMAEVLKTQGYRTFAVHGISLRSLGLERGFDEYRSTRSVTPATLPFLEEHARDKESRPFFAWLHYYSPHHTYEKREGFDFGDDDVARYDSEIAFDDGQIGILLDRLDALGLRERTIVFLTADHGEEFRDHGGTQHGFRLYRELTNVPLLVFLPGAAPSVVKTPVELVDVFPTVCELLGITKRCPKQDGLSLLAAVAGKRDPERGAYSELRTRGDTPSMNALFDGRWRMIYDYEQDRAELYDATTDRAEQHNVAGAHPDLVRRFRERLAMRPIERQAAVLGRALRSKDGGQLVEALPVLRHERLLTHALNKLAPVMTPSYVPGLEKLRRRPGLSRALRRKIDELIVRGRQHAAPSGKAP
jgi:arylsulfatase A-like enzyme